MKRLFGFLLALAVVSFAIVSCKDDFNEEEFLKLQSQLRLDQDAAKRERDAAYLDAANQEQAEAQVAAANQAGDLMSVTILVRENGVPVDDATVSITGGAPDATAGRTAATVSANTNADGVAFFEKVTIGAATVSLSKTGYTTASALIDFGSPNPPSAISTTINGVTKTTYVPPTRRDESIILPMFSKAGGATATIKGTVRIQSDLTNNTTEFPTGVTVQADYSALVGSVSAGSDNQNSGVTINGYRFDDGNFGTATVDPATGAYSMVVPASTSGSNVTLVFPTLELNQRIAVARFDGQDITPEYRNAPAIFGPNANGFGAVPTVAGAVAVFPAPPAPGAGLNFTFTARPRSLGTWNSYASGNNVTQPFEQGNVVYQVTNRGAGYSASPTVTVAGNGTGAQMKASLRGVLSGVTVVNGGAGYVNNENVTVTFNYKDNTSPTPVSRFLASYNAQVTVTGGVITAIAAPGTPVSWETASHGSGTGFDVTALEIVISGGSGTTTATASPVTTGELDHLQMTNGGSAYTTVTGVTVGSGGATIAVREVKNQWTISAPTRTAPYSVLPEGLQYQYTTLLGNPTITNGVTDQDGNTGTLLGILRPSGSGDVVFADPTKTWRTTAFSATAPTLVETQQKAVQARARVSISANGEIDGLDIADLGTDATFNAGDGYAAPLTVAIQPTIATAPGSGAALSILLNVHTPATGEYQWTPTTVSNGFAVNNAGSGYLQNLNQYNTAGAANANPTVNVRAGQTYTVDYDYNGGFRTQDFN